MTTFERTAHDLGALCLRPLTAENAKRLGAALSAIPPWSVIGYPAERLAGWLQQEEPTMRKFEVLAGEALAGVIVIQDPFLHGPYLKLIAILLEFQGRSFGLRLLQWMEAEARQAEARQLWLCVSTFNTRARAFYQRFGFEAVAVLDKLASDASDELLMRKRLSYGASRG
jgi:ribosomal protein S18 acetylase RimI-like enzyme